jgi:hypothetical protein
MECGGPGGGLTFGSDTATPSIRRHLVTAAAGRQSSLGHLKRTPVVAHHAKGEILSNAVTYTVEIGHPQLIAPVFFRHFGKVMESLAFEMGRDGPANGTVQLVAQGERRPGRQSMPRRTPSHSSASARPADSSGAAVFPWPASPAAASLSPTTWSGCG